MTKEAALSQIGPGTCRPAPAICLGSGARLPMGRRITAGGTHANPLQASKPKAREGDKG